jgi:hypothetical protein
MNENKEIQQGTQALHQPSESDGPPEIVQFLVWEFKWTK